MNMAHAEVVENSHDNRIHSGPKETNWQAADSVGVNTGVQFQDMSTGGWT